MFKIVVFMEASATVYDVFTVPTLSTMRQATEECCCVQWYPTGLEWCINYQQPTVLPGEDLAEVMRAVCMVSKPTAIAKVFSRIELSLH